MSHRRGGGCGPFGLGIRGGLRVLATIATVGSQTKVTAVLERFPDMDPDTIIVRDRRRFREQVAAAAAADRRTARATS